MNHLAELKLHQYMTDAVNGKSTMSDEVINQVADDVKDSLQRQFGGKTKRGDKELTFVFTIKKQGNTYESTMAVPTFRVSGVKPKSTTYSNGKLIIDGSNVGMNYQGEFNKDSQQFEGTYKEGAIVLKLNLKKGGIKIADSRRS